MAFLAVFAIALALAAGELAARWEAELAGVATPNLDDVIVWCQEKMGKEYLVDGKLCGKDLDSTRSPQHYGINDLDTFMKMNHYVGA